jgi:hypothetical protein
MRRLFFTGIQNFNIAFCKCSDCYLVDKSSYVLLLILKIISELNEDSNSNRKGKT